MRLSAAEIKQLTGCATRVQGENALYARLEAQTWFKGERSYCTAGFDRRKDLIHFTATWAVEGGAAHSRLGLPLKLALECGGDLTQATTLH